MYCLGVTYNININFKVVCVLLHGLLTHPNQEQTYSEVFKLQRVKMSAVEKIYAEDLTTVLHDVQKSHCSHMIKICVYYLCYICKIVTLLFSLTSVRQCLRAAVVKPTEPSIYTSVRLQPAACV